MGMAPPGALVRNAQAAGSPAIVLTVDRQGGCNTEDMFRMHRLDQRDCTLCHKPDAFANEVSRKANFNGIDVSKVTNLYGTGMTWELIDRLRAIVKGKLVLKGIMTGTDAKEAMRHGVDAIIVSNHGGQRKKAGRRRLSAVGIGRPYVWGLASFGEAGVDRALEIMDSEFVTIMRQVGR
jgi:4-hydroxymandelate oxidase